MSESAVSVSRADKAIALWLLVLCAMVFVMIVLGGVTRLTHSGLSMADWKPLTRWLPPLTTAGWEELFALYKQTPEYLKKNAGMDLAGFQGIFWMEFLHRLWGRFMGIVFAIPFVVFFVKGWIKGPLVLRIGIVFVLGALQGVLGWYMVKSGLVDRPDVSQYRLTAHLGAAVLIFGYMLWLALALLKPTPQPAPTGTHGWAMALLGLVVVTLLSGGFVAGTDAGFGYNTFPLMDGQLIPDTLFYVDPWWLSLFEDTTTIQFNHRLLAETTFVVAMIFVIKAWRRPLSKGQRVAVIHVGVVAVLQVVLGISTLLLVVPVWLAATHQAGAIVLLAVVLWAAYEFRRGATQS